MEYAVAVEASFDAGHRIPDHPTCNDQHGHTYQVTAGIIGPLLAGPDGLHRVRHSGQLQAALDGIARSLDLRDLDHMMAGSVTVPETIAAWILERIPECDEIKVRVGWRGETGLARRTRR